MGYKESYTKIFRQSVEVATKLRAGKSLEDHLENMKLYKAVEFADEPVDEAEATFLTLKGFVPSIVGEHWVRYELRERGEETWTGSIPIKISTSRPFTTTGAGKAHVGKTTS